MMSDGPIVVDVVQGVEETSLSAAEAAAIERRCGSTCSPPDV
jgi:hypothetical protein